MRTSWLIQNVHMGLGHDGLTKVAKANGCVLKNLKPQTVCVFISRDRTRLKAVAPNYVMLYMRAKDQNRPFDIESLHEFAHAFSATGKMDYPKALEKVLIAALDRRARKPTYSPLETAQKSKAVSSKGS